MPNPREYFELAPAPTVPAPESNLLEPGFAAQRLEAIKLSLTTTAATSSALTNARFSSAIADADPGGREKPTELAHLPSVKFDSTSANGDVQFSFGPPEPFDPVGTPVDLKNLFGSTVRRIDTASILPLGQDSTLNKDGTTSKDALSEPGQRDLTEVSGANEERVKRDEQASRNNDPAEQHNLHQQKFGTAVGAAIVFQATIGWLKPPQEKRYKFELPTSK